MDASISFDPTGFGNALFGGIGGGAGDSSYAYGPGGGGFAGNGMGNILSSIGSFFGGGQAQVQASGSMGVGGLLMIALLVLAVFFFLG